MMGANLAILNSTCPLPVFSYTLILLSYSTRVLFSTGSRVDPIYIAEPCTIAESPDPEPEPREP